MQEPLLLTEQRTTSISFEEYRTLVFSDSMAALVDTGVVSFVRSKSVSYGIRAGAFVGHALINDTRRLVIQEKASGAIEELLHWAVPASLREARVPAAIADGTAGLLFETFARRYLSHLEAYLRYGRLKEYQRRTVDRGPIRGQIDVGRTARLRSRGRAGAIAFIESYLTADILPNRLLGLALLTIESHFRFVENCHDIVQAARLMAPLFDDVDYLGLSQCAWETRSAAFSSVLADGGVDGDLAHALAYARALVLHLGPWRTEQWEQGVPTSFFLNLQTLFEDAVRQVLGELVAESVTRGSEVGVTLFEEIPDAYEVAPDIVVGSKDSPALVFDCKYKMLDGLPAHGDVYQLAAHSAALGCGTAVLIYPGYEYDYLPLGTTRSGVEVCRAFVRVSRLTEDLGSLAREVGLKMR